MNEVLTRTNTFLDEITGVPVMTVDKITKLKNWYSFAEASIVHGPIEDVDYYQGAADVLRSGLKMMYEAPEKVEEVFVKSSHLKRNLVLFVLVGGGLMWYGHVLDEREIKNEKLRQRKLKQEAQGH
jgi:hypothetical protein